jgi:hypothetical protein
VVGVIAIASVAGSGMIASVTLWLIVPVPKLLTNVDMSSDSSRYCPVGKLAIPLASKVMT